MSYYSGISIDWSSVVLGGIGQNLSIYDIRGKKLLRTKKMSYSATQISSFARLNSHEFLFSNVNSIHKLDIKTMSTELLC